MVFTGPQSYNAIYGHTFLFLNGGFLCLMTSLRMHCIPGISMMTLFWGVVEIPSRAFLDNAITDQVALFFASVELCPLCFA